MNGRSNIDIFQERQQIQERFTYWNGECRFIDSILADCDNGPIYCLGESIKLMQNADIVIFAPGWENARGCRIEHKVCEEYGIYFLEI